MLQMLDMQYPNKRSKLIQDLCKEILHIALQHSYKNCIWVVILQDNSVWSSPHDAAANAGVLSVYLTIILYIDHRLFFDREREYTPRIFTP